MKSWRTLSSTYTFEDQWIKLRTDNLESPQGRLVEGYHTLEAPDWVNIIAISQSDGVVLVEQYRPSIARARLELSEMRFVGGTWRSTASLAQTQWAVRPSLGFLRSIDLSETRP